MKQWILHSWNDEKCLKLLRNCYQALPDNGKVLVVDMVIPETPEPSAAVKSSFQPEFFSTNMKTYRKEMTEAEFAKLGKEAGFSNTKVACCAYNFSVVEFHKNM